MKAFLALFALFSVLHAATLQGNVYSADSFDAVQGALVKAEGASTYQVLSSDGTYSMEVAPGAYNVSAYYYENGTLTGYAEDGIVVGAEGASYDIVLFSPDEFEGVEGFGFADVDENIPEARKDDGALLAGGLVLLIAAVVAAAYLLLGRKKGAERGEEPPAERKELDEEEKKVIEILEGSEGMRNQKELREILKCTDTKISLLISSLEAQGYVKRIKKGRENIVKLVKK